MVRDTFLHQWHTPWSNKCCTSLTLYTGKKTHSVRLESQFQPCILYKEKSGAIWNVMIATIGNSNNRYVYLSTDEHAQIRIFYSLAVSLYISLQKQDTFQLSLFQPSNCKTSFISVTAYFSQWMCIYVLLMGKYTRLCYLGRKRPLNWVAKRLEIFGRL